MRIFVSYLDESGTKRTTRIAINANLNTNQFLSLIASKLGYKKSSIIIALKQQSFQLRIIDGWPLTHYHVKNGSKFEVKFNQKYSAKQNNHDLSQILEDQNNQEEGQHSIEQFDEYLQEFLSAIRNQNLDQISKILKKQPQNLSEVAQQKVEQILRKKINYLLNQIGQCGRNSLHWAIHTKNIQIINFLLIHKCSLQSYTIDGYFPLQLAIQIQFKQAIDIFLHYPKADINQQGPKGSALHTAVLKQDQQTIQKLLKLGIDTGLVNNQSKTALQLCKNDRIKQKIVLFQKKEKKIHNPYIVKGLVSIVGFAWRLKQRQIVVNPFKNTLTIYDAKKTGHKITINQIKKLSIVQKGSWLQDEKFTYLEMVTNKQSVVFAVKHKNIANRYIELIEEAIGFCKDEQAPKIKEEQQLIQSLDDKNNQIVVHKRKVNNKLGNSKSISIFNLPVFEDDPIDKNSPNLLTVPKNYSNRKISQDYSDNDSLRDSQISLGSVVGDKSLLGLSNKFSALKRTSDTVQTQSIPKGNHRPCFKDFELKKLIGQGSFGKVFLAKYKRTNKQYALKILNKRKLSVQKQLKYAIGQCNILKKVNSPFIIKMYYSFQTLNNIYMAIDYCSGGDLSEFIFNKEKLSQKIARFFIAQVILGIEHLHKQKILYRDLKPQNILLGEDGYIYLTDFGLSKENTFSKSFCGSPAYLSPEMLDKKGVGAESDIYGIGCVLYQMLTGQPPYFDENIDQLFTNIRQGKLKFPAFVSKCAKSLIFGLLQRNVKKRLGVSDMNAIKQHEFFKDFSWKDLQKKQMKIPDGIIIEKFQQIDLQMLHPKQFVDIDYENSEVMMNRIKNFTFSRYQQIEVEQFDDEMV